MAGLGFGRRVGGVSPEAIAAAVAQYIADNPPPLDPGGDGEPAGGGTSLSEAQVKAIVSTYLLQNPQGDGTGFNQTQVEGIISDFLAANPPVDDAGFTESEINGFIVDYLAANPQGDGTGFTEEEVVDIVKGNLDDVFPENFDTPGVVWGVNSSGEMAWIPTQVNVEGLPDKQYASNGQVVTVNSQPGQVFEMFSDAGPGWSNGQFTVTAGVNDELKVTFNSFFTNTYTIAPGSYTKGGLAQAINNAWAGNFYGVTVFGTSFAFIIYGINTPMSFVNSPTSFLKAIGIQESFFGTVIAPTKSVNWQTPQPPPGTVQESNLPNLIGSALDTAYPWFAVIRNYVNQPAGAKLTVVVTEGFIGESLGDFTATGDVVYNDQSESYSMVVHGGNNTILLDNQDNGSQSEARIPAGTYSQESLSAAVKAALYDVGVDVGIEISFYDGYIIISEIKERYQFQYYSSSFLQTIAAPDYKFADVIGPNKTMGWVV